RLGPAANPRRERLAAAFEIDQLDLDTRFFVFAELLGEYRRQIAQTTGSADRDGDFCKSGTACERQDGQGHADLGKQFRDHGVPPVFEAMTALQVRVR